MARFPGLGRRGPAIGTNRANALERVIGAPKVVKRLHPAYLNHEHLVSQFVLEGKIYRQMAGDPSGLFVGRVEVIERFRWSRRDFEQMAIVMDRVDSGKDPLTIAEKVRVACLQAAAIDRLHDAGYIHRDIKPENFIIGANGRPVLIDFGISLEMSQEDNICEFIPIGTPAWIAPEVAFGRKNHPSLDVYALGLVILNSINKNLPISCDQPTVFPYSGWHDAFGVEAHRAAINRLFSETARLVTIAEEQTMPRDNPPYLTKGTLCIEPSEVYEHWLASPDKTRSWILEKVRLVLNEDLSALPILWRQAVYTDIAAAVSELGLKTSDSQILQDRLKQSVVKIDHEGLQALLRRMVDVDYRKRPSAHEAAQELARIAKGLDPGVDQDPVIADLLAA